MARKRPIASGRIEYQIQVPRRSPTTAARVSQDAQVVRDGRLGDAVTCGDVTGAHGPGQGELAQDRKPDGVGGRLQEQDVRVRLTLHLPIV